MDQKAKSIERGIAVLYFVSGGLIALQWRNGGGRDMGALVLGGLLALLGVGLLMHMRWARWVTLGLCFIAMIAAFAMPVWLTLWRPFEGFDPQDPVRLELMTCAFAATFGWLGYQGLGYLRSAGAWNLYEIESESSLTVLASALCMGLLLAVVGKIRGVSFAPATPSQAHVPAGESSADVLPDLVPVGLCMQGDSLVQAVIENRGRGWVDRGFSIQYSNLGFRGGTETSHATVPKPGQKEIVALNNAVNPAEQEEAALDVQIVVDWRNQVRESNESNNVEDIPVKFRYFYPSSLPACASLTNATS
jgi:hypothetical protein